MRLYFPDLITSIDTGRESRRLAGIRFSTTPPVRKASAPPAPAPPTLTKAEKSLEEAEALYNEKKYDEARAAFTRVLSETSVSPLQAKAYYGLGRIAARVTRDPDTVVKLFEKALELRPPAPERAWTLIYLGRLSELANDPVTAAKHYRAALDVEGASPGAHKAAEQGLQKTLPPGSKE